MGVHLPDTHRTVLGDEVRWGLLDRQLAWFRPRHVVAVPVEASGVLLVAVEEVDLVVCGPD